MKRILFFILVLSFCLSVKAKTTRETSISMSAGGAILMEKDSGRILYQKNINVRFLTASLAKIMTALVAIEHGDLSGITLSMKMLPQEGSSLYLEAGDKVGSRTCSMG